MPAPRAVIAAAEAHFEETLQQLEELARIPSVSAAGFDPAAVVRSAEAVAGLLSDLGLEDVELLRVGDAHPYVVAEWRRAGPEAPTVLLYAHHDVQPPGRESHWKSPPFEPCRRDDGRIYGRGIVDDKAGVLVFVAAIRAWLEAADGPPVNAKIVVEGEEEIGSTHLEEFLAAYRERLASDVMVLSDTANLEAGLPSITTSLRGLVNVDVTVRALDHPLHSGMWGGPVPDAASALGILLGRLFDADGEPAIPGLADDVPALDERERAELDALPFDRGAFREDAGVVASARIAGSAVSGSEVWERLWRRPALAVTALEARPLAEAANQLIDTARARIGLRLAPGQDAERALARLVGFLEENPPWGVEVTTESDTAVAGWSTTPEGPAFDAARRALSLGFGREAVCIGCGGSIPFVAPFASVLGDVPALLLGLEDPICNAHGENESLHVEDFRKAIVSATHLFAELADAWRR
jgi:acetylornithine deacetylase/succinyl-diaminopimelate desuccinylase-like protein